MRSRSSDRRMSLNGCALTWPRVSASRFPSFLPMVDTITSSMSVSSWSAVQLIADNLL